MAIFHASSMPVSGLALDKPKMPKTGKLDLKPKNYDSYKALTPDAKKLLDSLSKSELRKFGQHFIKYDLNRDGIISKGELKTFLLAHLENPTDTQVNELLGSLDANQDNKVDFAEFLAVVANQKGMNCSKKDIQMIFNEADINKDGKICAYELKIVFAAWGVLLNDESIDDLIGSLDKNGDGVLNVKEFTALVKDSMIFH